MPIERGSDVLMFSALTDEHRKAAVEFYRRGRTITRRTTTAASGSRRSGRATVPLTRRC